MEGCSLSIVVYFKSLPRASAPEVQYTDVRIRFWCPSMPLSRLTVFSTAALIAALPGIILLPSAKAETCYFNGRNAMKCTPSWSYGTDTASVKIQWADGVKEIYRFKDYDGSNASLGIAIDPRGGRWQFIDKRDGCNWELKHISNSNSIRVSRCR